MGIIKSTIEDVDAIFEKFKVLKSWLNTRGQRASGYSYRKLLNIEGYSTPYICLLNDWNEEIKKYSKSDCMTPIIKEKEYRIPLVIPDIDLPIEVTNGNACRLMKFNVSTGKKLEFSFQQTKYYDYLKSSHMLDFPFPPDEEKTYREQFGDEVSEHNGTVRPFDHLTNISGVGLFLITRDKYVVVSRLSEKNTTYPDRYTYSTSGLMRWGFGANPFTEMKINAYEKLGIKLDEKKLQLIGFGADARQLYFQFSFIYETSLWLKDVMEKVDSLSSSDRKIHGIELSPSFLVNSSIENCWEPSAVSALYNACALYSSKKEVEEEVDKYRSQWVRSAMRDEWDYRASKSMLLSVMSVRYDQVKLDKISKKFVTAVVEFIGDKIKDKDIVEIGSGIGRLTKALLNSAKHITCLDISKKMIMRSVEYLRKPKNVKHIQMFGQDYCPQRTHDVAICSLVLIHNPSDIEYERLIENLCNIAKKVYLFEDVSSRELGCSHATVLRNKEYIIDQFSRFGFAMRSSKQYRLEMDNLIFMEFDRDKKIEVDEAN